MKVTYRGKEYTITEIPLPNHDLKYLKRYAHNHKYYRFYAQAVDTEGNYYRVTWEATSDYIAWMEDYIYGQNPENYAYYANVESTPCDWDNPISVKPC